MLQQLVPDQVLSQNKANMSVTPPVSHVEMWPYAASAAVAFESHAATAVLMVLSVMIVGQRLDTARLRRRTDVVARGVKHDSRSTPSSTHQPRSWSKAEAS